MNHLDLFSGIGGFAYAADQVFGGGITHIFCDNEPFAQQVLKKHWPEAYIYDDIRNITYTKSEGPERVGGQEPPVPICSGRIDLLTGGFPCQPFSSAGARRGTTDDRYLWPEMLRVIRLTAPEWVIAENVGGLVTWNEGMVLEQVCLDLEAAGYEVQPFVIPAVAVNAPHRRDRIWFVAHAVGSDDRGTPGENGGKTEEERLQERHEVRKPGKPSEVPADTRRTGWEQRPIQVPSREKTEWGAATEEDKRFGCPEWDKDWMEVATEFCSVDDGLPIELDGFKLTKAQHRAAQLKGYGNAIVPQVAMEIMKVIKEASYA